MFKTDRLLLRGYQPSDQDFILDLLNTYDVLANLTAAPITPSHDVHLEMWDRMIKCALFVVVCDKESSEMMGFTLINITTPRNLDGEVGIALHKSYWSKGYATEVMNWLIGYSFKVLGLRRLSILVFSSNTRAIPLYERMWVSPTFSLSYDSFFMFFLLAGSNMKEEDGRLCGRKALGWRWCGWVCWARNIILVNSETQKKNE